MDTIAVRKLIVYKGVKLPRGVSQELIEDLFGKNSGLSNHYTFSFNDDTCKLVFEYNDFEYPNFFSDVLSRMNGKIAIDEGDYIPSKISFSRVFNTGMQIATIVSKVALLSSLDSLDVRKRICSGFNFNGGCGNYDVLECRNFNFFLTYLPDKAPEMCTDDISGVVWIWPSDHSLKLNFKSKRDCTLTMDELESDLEIMEEIKMILERMES